MLTAKWSIVLEDSSDAFAAQLLADEIRAKHGWAPPVHLGHRPETPAIRLSFENLPMSAEAYRLVVAPTQISISASSSRGRYYAIQTLRQIIRTNVGTSLRSLEILDWPEMSWRGVSDDLSRGQMPRLSSLLALMETLGYYKLNLYALYLEDVVTSEADSLRGLTVQDLAALAAEARRHHIVLMPIYQTMGYNARITRALEHQGPPWLWRHLPQANPRSPFAPWTAEGITRDIDAIASAVPSPWFHIGGDELGTFGLTNPAAAGVAPDGSTHSQFVAHLGAHVLSAYRRPVVYSDFLVKFPEVAQSLDRSTAVVDWNYRPGESYGTTRRFIEMGFRQVFVSPGLWNWNSFYPHYARGLANVQAFIDTGKAAGAAGAITSSWGDNGSESLRDNNRLGYAYGASVSWETRARPIDEFYESFTAVEYGVDSPELVEAQRLVGLQTLPVDYVGRAFHRLPRVRSIGVGWKRDMLHLEEQMETALASISHVSVGDARRPLESLRHAARRFRYLAVRELTMDVIARDLTDYPEGAQERAASTLRKLELEFEGLTTEYEALWLERNKRDALDYSLSRLRRQADQLHAMRVAAEANELRVWTPGVERLAQTLER